MIALASSLTSVDLNTLLVVSGLVGLFGIAALPRWGRHSIKRTRLQIHPRCRNWLGQQGFSSPRDFMELEGVTVSGHPDRNVTRVLIDSNHGLVPCYLKREYRIPFSVKLRNLLSGFGWISRSVRECQVLIALEQHGVGGPGWIAAGEDAQGRAFLLLREKQTALDLPRVLQTKPGRLQRRQLCRFLAENLAHMHYNGFSHRDLYANHVLISPNTLDVCVIDWQRARCYKQLSDRKRGQDLAALNATLSPTLCCDQDRWYFFHHYLKESHRLGIKTGINLPANRLLSRPSARTILAAVLASTARRLRHRHVLEKRQQGLSQLKQDWHRIQGNALSINSRLKQVFPGVTHAWLDLDRQPLARNQSYTRRWIPLSSNRLALLERRRLRFGKLFSRRLSTQEQKRSVLLLRLERHGLKVPGILATGQKKLGTGSDSFLLTDHPVKTLRLDLWLKRQARQVESGEFMAVGIKQRQTVLFQVGTMLSQLHQACCYLNPACDAGLFAIVLESFSGKDGIPVTSEHPSSVVLQDLAEIKMCRMSSLHQIRQDLQSIHQILVQAGCNQMDLEIVERGYRGEGSGEMLSDHLGKETFSCQP